MDQFRRWTIFVASTALLVTPFLGNAQPGKRPATVIGVLHAATRVDASIEIAILAKALRNEGFNTGENLRIEYRFADYDYDKLAELAKDLVRAGVRVIYAPTTSAVVAAQEASRSVPIVFSAVNNPVGRGLVKSLARPGGNTTGISIADIQLTGKRVELMKELFPHHDRVGFVYDRDAAAECGIELKDVGAASRQVKLGMEFLPYRQRSELVSAFAKARQENIPGLLVPTSYETRRFGGDLASQSVAQHVALVHSDSAAVEAGGLMSYGPSREWAVSRAAFYIARILKGSKPAELPIEQPSRYELVINLKTARAMGLTIPQSVLLRADRVIE